MSSKIGKKTDPIDLRAKAFFEALGQAVKNEFDKVEELDSKDWDIKVVTTFTRKADTEKTKNVSKTKYSSAQNNRPPKNPIDLSGYDNLTNTKAFKENLVKKSRPIRKKTPKPKPSYSATRSDSRQGQSSKNIKKALFEERNEKNETPIDTEGSGIKNQPRDSKGRFISKKSVKPKRKTMKKKVTFTEQNQKKVSKKAPKKSILSKTRGIAKLNQKI